MARKDYIRIAKAFYYARNWEQVKEANAVVLIERLAQVVADELADDNPRFDREHFLAVVRGEKALESKPGLNT